MTPPLPLDGLTILAVEQYGAGPFCSQNLAQMGARVIKIEDPASGDSSRQSGPHFIGPGDSHFFMAFNQGKQSLALDMRSAEGRAVFRRLVAQADGVINNLRGDQPGKLGLTHDALRDINPRIVCGHLSGYGRTGERATWPAYDWLAQAEAGFFSLTGEPGTPPARFGIPMIDFMSGMTLAFGMVAGILSALKTGQGRDVDVTLYDVAMQQLTYPAAWYLNEGDAITRRPRSGHPSVVPCEMFPTADGNIVLMCILPKFWEAMARIVGHPELPDDPRFRGFEERWANRDALAAILDAALVKKTTAEWMALMAGQVPAAPVLTLAQALDNPYYAATGGVQAFDHPQRAGFRVVSSPLRLDGVRPVALPAPMLGADTDAVLAAAGFGAGEIRDLRDRRVVGRGEE